MNKRDQDRGTISIQGHDHSYRVVDGLTTTDGKTELNGYYRGDAKEVLLAAGLEPRYEKEILVHEILHGILWQSGHEPETHKDCEDLVYALTFGLLSVRINGKPLIR